MRSFIPTLLVAALAVFTSAAPIDLPNSPPNPGLPPVAGVVSSTPQVNTLKNEVDSPGVTDPVDTTRNVEGTVLGAGEPTLGQRATPSSIAAIFQGLAGQIVPDTRKMTFLSPSDTSVPEITNTADSIKNPIVATIADLQALAGVEQSAIMAPADGAAQSGELDVGQVALIIGQSVAPIYSAMQHAVDVAQSNGNFDQVQAPLSDLGKQVAGVIAVSIELVSGLDVALSVVLRPIQPIIVKLHVDLGIVL